MSYLHVICGGRLGGEYDALATTTAENSSAIVAMGRLVELCVGEDARDGLKYPGDDHSKRSGAGSPFLQSEERVWDSVLE